MPRMKPMPMESAGLSLRCLTLHAIRGGDECDDFRGNPPIWIRIEGNDRWLPRVNALDEVLTDIDINLQRVHVNVAAEERHVVRDRDVRPELQVAADDRLDAVGNVSGGGRHRGKVLFGTTGDVRRGVQLLRLSRNLQGTD